MASNDVHGFEPIEVPTPIHEPNHEPLEEQESRQHESSAPDDVDESVEQARSGEPKRKGGEPTQVGGVAVGVYALIIQVIVLCLAVIATPLDVFRNKNPRSFIPDSSRRACYSMWGYKCCGTCRNRTGFTVNGVDFGLPVSGYMCRGYRSRLRAASSFAIIGIFFSLMTLIFIILSMCRVMKSFVAGILAVVSTVSLLIAWACVLGTYYKSCLWSYNGPGLIIVAKTERMKDEYNLGAGFGILVGAFGLQLICAILLFIF